ncbi:MAG: NADH-quinone oxidoreductase subunit J, partial [Alphaproteobacteria bacterium]|nr:NADH-quinone oxidoreductase subunit J [Alphaproteobacteria bacterium]
YLFSGWLLAAGVMVVTARNPVHSVLFLILAFFNAAGLFLLLGAEFLAMILVVVYVGAVAVLFLFVVMMLNINFVILREGFLQYLPVGGLVGLILLVELALVSGGWAFAPEVAAAAGTPSTLIAPSGVMTNTRALGDVLYTQYFYLFQAAGLVLLVAMIGAIVLTHRSRPGVRKQDISRQVSQPRKDSVEIRKVPIGGGV